MLRALAAGRQRSVEVTASRRRQLLLLPWLVLLLGLAVTGWLWQAARQDAERMLAAEFEFSADRVVDAIERQLDGNVQVLRGVVGLFGASEDVTRQEFAAYVAALRLDERYPGILGVGFSLLVPPGRKAAHTAAIRREGFPDYAIRPDGEREVHTSIIYLEPFSGRNLRAFGYDMFSEPVRQAAMARARDENRASLSAKVTLVQEAKTGVQPGFLIYVPVYRRGLAHDTVEERRANLLGWAYSPLRMYDLMHGVLGAVGLAGVLAGLDIEIYDGATIAPEALMFDSDEAHRATGGAAFRMLRPIEYGGHRWSLLVTSRTTFDARLNTDESKLIAFSGGIGSALLAALMGVLAWGQLRVAAALRATAQSNQRLAASEGRLQAFFDNAASLVWIKDLQGRFLVVNRHTEAVLGLPRERLLGRTVAEIFPQAEAAAFSSNDRQALEAGRCLEFEESARLDDGLRTYLSVKFPLRDAGGRIDALGAICTDISDRKEAEESLRASLEEKTVLLKEVHHRVKNNLQIITSLLNLQLNRTQIPEARETLLDTQSRIRSMALLHEALYRSGSLARIGLRQYVGSLCAPLWHAAGSVAANVRLEQRIDDLSLPLDQAVPCGLIINELVSNALKHAFPGGRSGQIVVAAGMLPKGLLTLSVADDGVGLPPGDPRSSDSLGLQLVFMLVSQLQGVVDIGCEDGTEFRIAFPCRAG
ncbi:CHASE domain-containing protein [Accumulibacter sp.]|uniref:CHASE domain-containing protein n=1 Tax=Accumulibacter sp. TaxID=2053492 RepID=UPI0025F903DA|nr:CHASE domain-containing protein [Accumulibacter sp.]MCM8611428.1 CHASE domain-containing protein [Accumulibacter sp.]MCM8634925.1 CHASE domain-containing protein [Accumulibacter sp.]MCM8638556.1 CHASE domain-containing protein [Accumulibacter sp.]